MHNLNLLRRAHMNLMRRAHKNLMRRARLKLMLQIRLLLAGSMLRSRKRGTKQAPTTLSARRLLLTKAGKR